MTAAACGRCSQITNRSTDRRHACGTRDALTNSSELVNCSRVPRIPLASIEDGHHGFVGDDCINAIAEETTTTNHPPPWSSMRLATASGSLSRSTARSAK
jgi:hypothetical protein